MRKSHNPLREPPCSSDCLKARPSGFPERPTSHVPSVLGTHRAAAWISQLQMLHCRFTAWRAGSAKQSPFSQQKCAVLTPLHRLGFIPRVQCTTGEAAAAIQSPSHGVWGLLVQDKYATSGDRRGGQRQKRLGAAVPKTSHFLVLPTYGLASFITLPPIRWPGFNSSSQGQEAGAGRRARPQLTVYIFFPLL